MFMPSQPELVARKPRDIVEVGRHVGSLGGNFECALTRQVQLTQLDKVESVKDTSTSPVVPPSTETRTPHLHAHKRKRNVRRAVWRNEGTRQWGVTGQATDLHAHKRKRNVRRYSSRLIQTGTFPE